MQQTAAVAEVAGVAAAAVVSAEEGAAELAWLFAWHFASDQVCNT